MEFDSNVSAMIAVALYAASEIIGMSKLRSNSVIQMVLTLLMRVFPKK